MGLSVLVCGRQTEFVIDSGNSTNLVAQCVVLNFKLQTKIMAYPYQLAWIKNATRQIFMSDAYLVNSVVGEYYHDYVWCYVISIMGVYHPLLGRPSQFD